MLAIQVDIDGEKYAVIGAVDWSLLHAEIIAMFAEPDSKIRDGYVEFKAYGLTLPDSQNIRHHLRWVGRTLDVGSVVTMTVVDTEQVDPPTKRYRSDATVQESSFTEEENARDALQGLFVAQRPSSRGHQMATSRSTRTATGGPSAPPGGRLP